MPSGAKAYITLVIAAGSAVLVAAVALWPSTNWRMFAIYLSLAALTSTFKVRMPGVEATMSLSFVFVLLGIAACNFPQVVAISMVAALVQALWASGKRPRLVQVAFSAAALMISTAAAYSVSRLFVAGSGVESPIALVVLAGSVYFPLNTALVSMVVGLVEGRSLKPLFLRSYQWTFAYFMFGIVFAGLVSGAYARSTMWKGALAILPAMVLAYAYFVNRASRTVPSTTTTLMPPIEEEYPVEVHS